MKEKEEERKIINNYKPSKHIYIIITSNIYLLNIYLSIYYNYYDDDDDDDDNKIILILINNCHT